MKDKLFRVLSIEYRVKATAFLLSTQYSVLSTFHERFTEKTSGGGRAAVLHRDELSALVLAEKLAHVCETGARALATGNPGCHMQIGAGARLAGMELRVCHPIELLDESYRRAGRYKSTEY